MQRPVSYIDVEDPGQRIDNFLFKILKSVPKTRIYRMLRRGEVRVNGSRVKPAYRLQEGDRVRVPPVKISTSLQPPKPSSGLTATLEAAVLHEDEDLLAISKPSGLAVHGGSGIRLGAIEALRGARPRMFLELAHRL
ncbi:MAG: S4 domain-containing protein, partial [Pseudomonadales bacterium]